MAKRGRSVPVLSAERVVAVAPRCLDIAGLADCGGPLTVERGVPLGELLE